MFKSRDIRKFQYSFKTDWLGGVYATPTISGSRAAAPVVACWATLRFFGRAGYAKLASEIVQVTEKIANRLSLEIPGLVIIGRADLSIVAFTLKDRDVYDLCDALKKIPGRNWHLNLLQLPAACHLTVTAANVSLAKEFFVDDVKAAVAGLEGKVGKSETAAFYGATASAPIDLLEEIAEIYLDTCYQVSK
jgi:sphinganine-1-phosphate aldolase